MRKAILAIGIGIISISSCKKEVRKFTKEEIRIHYDSITKIRLIESDQQAQKDLDRRMRIEVKVKVDSIINARSKKGANDTLTKKQPPINRVGAI